MVSEEEHIYCQSSSLSMGKTVNSLFFQYGTKILHISETINYATRAQSITELGIWSKYLKKVAVQIFANKARIEPQIQLNLQRIKPQYKNPGNTKDFRQH